MKDIKALLIFSLLFFLLSPSVARAGLLVECSWLKARLKAPRIRIVDVSKDPSSFEKGHIPGAQKVFRHKDLEDYTQYPPVGYPRRQQFLELVTRLGIGNDTTVVAYDDNKNIYASRLVFLLWLYGHPLNRLKILDGGKRAWVKEGFNLEKGTALQVPPRTYIPKRRKEDVFASWQDIYREAVQGQNPNVLLLDVRREKEFEGEIVRSVRGGHIPSAINLDLAAIISKDEEGRWIGPSSLEGMLEKLSITKDKDIIIYCHSGDRSAHAFLIMKFLLGYPRVRIYEKAWLEWAVLQALPVTE